MLLFCFRSVEALEVLVIPSELALAKVYEYLENAVKPSFTEVSRLDKVAKICCYFLFMPILN